MDNLDNFLTDKDILENIDIDIDFDKGVCFSPSEAF